MLTSEAENLGGKGILEFFLPQVQSDLSGFSYILKEVTGDYVYSHFILVLYISAKTVSNENIYITHLTQQTTLPMLH